MPTPLACTPGCPGAPEPDRSASPSFAMPPEGLLPNVIYTLPASFFEGMEPFFHKDVVRLIASFQGLLNRSYGLTHQSLLYLDVADSDAFWLNYTRSPGGSFAGLQLHPLPTLNDFLEAFAAPLAACGLIYWDEAVPATANVAATICGLEGPLPVRYSEDPASLCALLKARGLAVRQSLVGLFGPNGSAYGAGFTGCGSAKNDAYRWAYERYFDRCSSRYLAYVLDGAGCVNGTPFAAAAPSPGLNCLYNHDYYIARCCFFFDLTCVDIEHPCDDLDQPLGTDLQTLRQILRGRYERAGGEFGQILGFPPWWVKYTTAKGMGKLVPTTLEWIYVALVTAYNLAKEADAAHPCSMSNASFYCRYQSKFSHYQNARPREAKQFHNRTRYFTFYGGDYDSAAWLKQHVKNFWGDPARGTLPLNWSFNPNLGERAPMVFDYVHEHQSGLDFFSGGDSGAGYVIPAALFSSCPQRELPSGADAWQAYSRRYYQAHDLSVTGFIINGHYPLTEEIMQTFAAISPAGNFHNCWNSTMASYHGVPFVYLHNGVSGKEDRVEDSAKAMYRHFCGRMKGYNFAGFRSVCDSPSDTKRLVERFLRYATEQNDGYDYEYVDTVTFFDLLRQSGQCDRPL